MSNDSVEIRSADGEWHEVRGNVTLNYVSDLPDGYTPVVRYWDEAWHEVHGIRGTDYTFD